MRRFNTSKAKMTTVTRLQVCCNAQTRTKLLGNNQHASALHNPARVRGHSPLTSCMLLGGSIVQRASPKSHRRAVNCASSADQISVLADADTVELRKSAGLLKTLTFVSFWTQLALSLVSGFILFFSVAVSHQSQDFSKWAGYAGVVLGLFSTFFAHGFNRLAKKLQRNEIVSRSWIVKSLLTNNTLNLLGIGSAIVGLQASVGNLVGKSLMTSNGFAYPPVPGSTVASLDIFALQALGNILLLHFISLSFTNVLLRVLNKPSPRPAA